MKPPQHLIEEFVTESEFKNRPGTVSFDNGNYTSYFDVPAGFQVDRLAHHYYPAHILQLKWDFDKSYTVNVMGENLNEDPIAVFKLTFK